LFSQKSSIGYLFSFFESRANYVEDLSQSTLIRDCKTMVRRDRNEEPTLVSYIVAEMKEWPGWLKSRGLEDVRDEGTVMGPTKIFLQKFRRLQAEVRDHLKGRLPSYAVPTIYFFLDKLPLNPNGKVDKSQLPFPDLAEQTEDASEEDLKRWESMSETEKKVASKWAELIRGVNAKTITPENNFFDLGGHSILAQQMLLAVRRETGANISINTLYEYPDLLGFSSQVDKHLAPSDGVDGRSGAAEEQDPAYARSLDDLLKELPRAYQTADPATIRASSKPTVFLTGATGFLGSYLIKDILERTSRDIRLIAHIRGVKDTKAGIERLQRSLQGYGLWQDTWSTRLDCVVGDLSKPRLGIDQQSWERLAEEVDIVIHNGATVHWVKRYPDMYNANVGSTLEAMRLCNEGKPKILTFVSSTSVLDTDHYVKLSDQAISTGREAISEDDDMEGSRRGLGTGYGQTKWVSVSLLYMV
jgi:L-aminoadipate-semialdehyde dehydrogenase